MNYKDPDTTSDEEVTKIKPSAKPSVKLNIKPNATGPTDDRINSQNNKTMHPTQWLPPLKSDTLVASSSDSKESDADTEPYVPEIQDDVSEVPQGTFCITVRSLKKTKKYHCKYCEKNYDSSKKLTDHHQKCHKIMYCTQCTRAFNNPTTYS